MRAKHRGFTVVITEVTTRYGTHWYSAYHSDREDGVRDLPPCDTYREAVSVVKDSIANYLRVPENSGR